jgi:glutamyl-tRNA reductase
MAARDWRPLLLIDIAVPRDIDPRVSSLEGVVLRDIDDLQAMLERNLSGRAAEAMRAEALIDHELERFTRWLQSLEVLPTIRALRARAETVARQVMAENEGRWESLSDADRERLGLVAATIAARLFQQPIARLKGAGEEHATYAYIQALRELFGLEGEASVFGPPRPAEPKLPAAGEHSQVTPLRPRRRESKP